jgi:hypothetical protein
MRHYALASADLFLYDVVSLLVGFHSVLLSKSVVISVPYYHF